MDKPGRWLPRPVGVDAADGQGKGSGPEVGVQCAIILKLGQHELEGADLAWVQAGAVLHSPAVVGSGMGRQEGSQAVGRQLARQPDKRQIRRQEGTRAGSMSCKFPIYT